jgi:hypothetical protein
MNNKTTPRDFFLHLGATVALYAAVIALVNLAFAVVDYLHPDALAGYFTANAVAWPISMLLVLAPILYVLEWMLVRDIRRMPEKADLWVRRWRIHLTLFLSGATIVGDLIALVNTYLSGEITSRFALKVLAILVICGVVFAYYLLARVMTEARGRGARKSLAAAGIVIILAFIALGFWIVGSPAHQRALRFDSERVNDLSTIQWQVLGHWQRLGVLPAKLDELKDPLSGTVIPTDPETGQPYEYAAKSNTAKTDSRIPTFELCATFSAETQDTKGRGAYPAPTRLGGVYMDSAVGYPGMPDNWDHGAGRTCFTRTIDPSRYPVTPVPTPKPI